MPEGGESEVREKTREEIIAEREAKKRAKQEGKKKKNQQVKTPSQPQQVSYWNFFHQQI